MASQTTRCQISRKRPCELALHQFQIEGFVEHVLNIRFRFSCEVSERQYVRPLQQLPLIQVLNDLPIALLDVDKRGDIEIFLGTYQSDKRRYFICTPDWRYRPSFVEPDSPFALENARHRLDI